MVTPLAATGKNGGSQASISVSRSVALSMFDSQGMSKSIQGLSTPIELLIPRDTSIVIPQMTLQNATGRTSTSTANNNRQFSLFYVNVTGPSATVTLSATFEFKSIDPTVGYVVIYRFDDIPLLNTSVNKTNGHRVFCPAGK